MESKSKRGGCIKVVTDQFTVPFLRGVINGRLDVKIKCFPNHQLVCMYGWDCTLC